MKSSLPDLLLFDLIFKLLSLALLTPVVAWLFQRLLNSSGETAIGNFDIARFLLTPLGLCAVVLSVILTWSIAFAALAGLMYIGHGRRQGRKVSFAHRAVLHGKQDTNHPRRRLVVPGRVGSLDRAARGGPGLVHLRHAALPTRHQFLLERSSSPKFLWACGIGAVLIAAAAALVLALAAPLFFLPEAALGDQSARSALRHSIQLSAGNRTRVFASIVVWAAVWFAISSLLNGFVYWVNWHAVQWAGEQTGKLLLVLGMGASAGFLVNYLLTFLATSLACLGIVGLLDDSRQRLGVRPLSAVTAPATLRRWPFWLGPRRLALVVIAAVLLIAGWVMNRVINTLPLEDRVDVTARWGASLAAPENSLSAVRRAIQDGATFVEVDVQRTADGALVIAHDNDLMRLARSPLVVSESKLEQLQAVDVGKDFGREFAGERLCTLEDVLEEAAGKVKVIIELKSYANDPQPLIADVLQLLQERRAFGDAVIMSLKYDEVRQVKQLRPEAVAGFVATASLGDLARLQVDFLAVSTKLATDVLVGLAHSQGKEVLRVDGRRPGPDAEAD